MLVIVWSLWLGALIGAILKLASPHRSPLSWMVVALIGAFGGMCGVYAARLGGLPASHRLAHYLAVGVVACGVVLLYAAVSRLVFHASVDRKRPTRPTIVF